MKRFIRYISYVAVVFVSFMLCVVFYREHPDVQAVFYIPALNVLIYSIITDNLFPHQSISSRRRMVERSHGSFTR